MPPVGGVGVQVQELSRVDGSTLVSFMVQVTGRAGERVTRRFATLEDAVRWASVMQFPVPRITEDECDRCHAPVLKVKTRPHAPGRPRLLDRAEILEPMQCPVCRTYRDEFGRKLQPDITCWRCGGEKVIGADPPSYETFLVDGDGNIREYTPGMTREPGEALHRKHRCGRSVPGQLDEVRARQHGAPGVVAGDEARRAA